MSESTKKEVWSWVKTIVFAVVLAWVVNHLLVVNAVVPTGSMENTIMPKDRIMANRLAYQNEEPQRGDVVVFQYPDDPTGKVLYVKRVLGLPGETLEMIDGKVYLNGSETPLEEPYLKEEAFGSFGPYVMGEDSYFMLGDNRNNSLDSRFWENTFVEKEKILGKVMFRYFPSIKKVE